MQYHVILDLIITAPEISCRILRDHDFPSEGIHHRISSIIFMAKLSQLTQGEVVLLKWIIHELHWDGSQDWLTAWMINTTTAKDTYAQ